METSFFTEDLLPFKAMIAEYRNILSEMKNPIKKFLFIKKMKKRNRIYLDKLKMMIYQKPLNLSSLHQFIVQSTLYRPVEYKEQIDVFHQLEEIKAIYKDGNSNPILVIFLYPKREEIRFARYVENSDIVIQYPRHVFIGVVSKETAVYEYDEEMIGIIRDFIWETCLSYLGDDLKCLE